MNNANPSRKSMTMTSASLMAYGVHFYKEPQFPKVPTHVNMWDATEYEFDFEAHPMGMPILCPDKSMVPTAYRLM